MDNPLLAIFQHKPFHLQLKQHFLLPLIEMKISQDNIAGSGAASVSGILSQFNAPEMKTVKALLNKYIDIAKTKTQGRFYVVETQGTVSVKAGLSKG